MKFRKVFIAFLIIVINFYSVLAQGYKAKIIGRVTDSTAAGIPNSTITVTNLATNQSNTVKTSETGDFAIPQLIPGKYSLLAEAPGFKRFSQPEFTLQVEQTARIEIQLEVGEISEEVLISDVVPLVNNENPTLGSVISNQEIIDIPLNGRNYLTLALLSPGVVPAAAGSNPYNINGSRSDYVNYLVDGVANINRRGNEPITTPSIDAIQEFKIITNSFSAEYGRLSSGVISVALKSGTNRFHGSLYEFFRNDAFDARSFFDSEPQKLNRNQFGAMISGPVYKNKTFFLANYEGYRNRQGETRLTRVPTTAERNGVFSSPIRNPFTGKLFADNTITPALLNPTALKLLSFIPLPNREGTLNYTTAANNRENRNDFLLKIDHHFNSKNQLTAEWLSNQTSGENPFRSTSIPGFGSTKESNKNLFSVSFTSVFSSSIVNEARFGFSRDKFSEHSVNTGKNTSSENGISGVSDGHGLANIIVIGLPEFGDATFLPDEWTDKEFSFSDTLNITKGRHFIRLGGDVQNSKLNNLFASFAGGQIAFNGAFTTNPFADFLLGLAVQTQRQVGTNLSHLSSSYYGLFFQDDWKVNNRLTLNLGLRYDVNLPATERDDRWANFIVSEGKQITAGISGFPRALVKTDHNNVSPRVGFAFLPFDNSKTVVRAGYGIFYSFDLLFTQYQLMGATAFPFTQLELFQAVAVGNPSLSNPFPNRPGITPGALSPNGWDYENPTPYMQSWNITFGREITKNLGVEVSYVGTKGTHLSQTANINQTIRTATGNITPFPGYGRILFQNLGANSNYNALQISVQKRFAEGFSFRSSFTWSKSIDDASFGSPSRLPQNPNDLQAERGLSEFDRRRVWNSDFVYQIPFGHNRKFGKNIDGLTDAFLGGWQINGFIQMLDGRPFTPVVSKTNSQAGFATRPDRIGTGEVENPTIDRWFDPTAFVIVPANQFRFGNSGRNILIGPGIFNVDTSLFKQFDLPRENQFLQFRAEFFNLTNRPNFGQPDARIDQPTAGLISTAAPGRQIQFGLKYMF